MKITNNASERLFAKGKSVSNDTRTTNLNNNDLIVGVSGAGKSGGYVVHNILSADDTSMVVADTKSQLCRLLYDRLRAKGYKVKTIDFIDPGSSDGYNPLKFVRKDKNGYNQQDILSIATTLIPTDCSDDPFWVNSARIVVACAVAYVLEAIGDCDKNMWSVIKVFKQMATAVDYQYKEYEIPFLEEWGAVHPRSYAYSKYLSFKATLPAEKTWGCICQYVSAELDTLEFDGLRHMFTSTKAVDIDMIGKEKTVVFLNISDTDRCLDKLANLFYTQLFQRLCKSADENPDGRLTVPVRVYLDDFATNTRIEGFDKLISVIRSRDLSVSIILQSLTQLKTIYTHPQAMTIVNNCDHILYMGGSDFETAEFLANRMGKSPENILTLPPNEVILIERGKKGEQCQRLEPYGCLKDNQKDK